jgi:hypothetical protein
MRDILPLRNQEKENWSSSSICRIRPHRCAPTIKGAMMPQPLFEFPPPETGCGETPYIAGYPAAGRRPLVVANATGCSDLRRTGYHAHSKTRRRGSASANCCSRTMPNPASLASPDKQAEQARECWHG